MTVAVLGVAAILAASYPAASTATKKETRAEKLRKALAACKKEKSRSKRKLCEHRVLFRPGRPKGPSRVITPAATGTTGATTGSETTGTGIGTTTGTGTTGAGTGITTGAPEADSGTLVVHVYLDGGPPPPAGCYGTKCPDELAPLYVEHLSPTGEAISAAETSNRTIPVVPGEYEVGLYYYRAHWGPENSAKVTIVAGQTVELTLYESIP